MALASRNPERDGRMTEHPGPQKNETPARTDSECEGVRMTGADPSGGDRARGQSDERIEAPRERPSPARRSHEDRNRKEPFEFGIVMAGAISAGAYTAGVFDFLIQALDLWERAKRQKPRRDDFPRHDVRLKVVSGASAGGITAALTAGVLGEDFEHASSEKGGDPLRNKLFECWVKKIGIRDLLGTSDLVADRPVQSILDSTVLGEIARSAFDFGDEHRPDRPIRPYLADPIHLLSVAKRRKVFNWQSGTLEERPDQTRPLELSKNNLNV